MTENKLYTLSQGTKNVLDALEEPITLKFYFSKGLAQQAPGNVSYAQRVEELLGEYEAGSGGKLVLEVKDPEPFSDTEDEAVASGLKGVPATSAGDMLYFGRVGTNSTDGTEVVEFFQD
ncbi:MAG: GldG family protein, partial [bacterium]